MLKIANRISVIHISFWALISKRFDLELEIGNRLSDSILNSLVFQKFALGLLLLLFCSIIEAFNACAAVKVRFSFKVCYKFHT